MDNAVLSEKDFQRFRELIYTLTGISMSNEKRQLVQSRVQRRLRALNMSSYGDYYDLVLRPDVSSEEIERLINCVTTNTTSFFRERHHFDFVADKIIPEIAAANRQAGIAPRLRVWHAGCSTGEEPYSLASTLHASVTGHAGWDIRQLASDIDTDVLAAASRGVYPEDRVSGIPLEQRRRMFLRGSGDKSRLYKVRPELQAWLTFKQVNLLAEPWPLKPEIKFDMIWCRNVVIYFDKPTQKKLFARFQQRLKPGGYLIIGHSESLLGLSDAFESVGQTIYRLPAVSGRLGKAA